MLLPDPPACHAPGGRAHRRPGHAPASAREGDEPGGAADAEAQAGLTARAAAPVPAAGPGSPEGPPRPSSRPRSHSKRPPLRTGDRSPGAARAGPEAAVPVAGAARGLSGDDSAERSPTGLPGTETHAGRSVLTAGHPWRGEGPDLPQGSRRRFSLS